MTHEKEEQLVASLEEWSSFSWHCKNKEFCLDDLKPFEQFEKMQLILKIICLLNID